MGQVADTLILTTHPIDLSRRPSLALRGLFVGLMAQDESAVLVKNTGVAGHAYGIVSLNTAKAVVFNSVIVQNGCGIYEC